ncbi:hypothetical protein BpHYR1_043151 [Brachionus plicatilis]|uniref:Uncharacterized protein n=1 Tax=Brachionus plicatilis TaxID=10195 RepID=A0A3M7RPI3_BRAPC|nr:hypothetical protein BpHYR1_043151 [Brachionus plicatilis]
MSLILKVFDRPCCNQLDIFLHLILQVCKEIKKIWQNSSSSSSSSSSWMTASCRMTPAREPESYEQPVLWSSILFLKELTLGASMTESGILFHILATLLQKALRLIRQSFTSSGLMCPRCPLLGGPACREECHWTVSSPFLILNISIKSPLALISSSVIFFSSLKNVKIEGFDLTFDFSRANIYNIRTEIWNTSESQKKIICSKQDGNITISCLFGTIRNQSSKLDTGSNMDIRLIIIYTLDLFIIGVAEFKSRPILFSLILFHHGFENRFTKASKLQISNTPHISIDHPSASQLMRN